MPLNGEIVCLDGEGRSLFLELLRHRRADPVFYAFDLLWLDGDDLRGLALLSA
jgi:ATP-dependent DNA ligase